jgi:hypothetical protein
MFDKPTLMISRSDADLPLLLGGGFLFYTGKNDVLAT